MAPAKPPMRILRPFQSSGVLISFRYQPPICEPVLPLGRRVNVIGPIELVHELDAAALVHPGVLHAAVEAKGNAGGEREGRVLAPVIVGGGMSRSRRCRRSPRRPPAGRRRSRPQRKPATGSGRSSLPRQSWRRSRWRRGWCREISGSSTCSRQLIVGMDWMTAGADGSSQAAAAAFRLRPRRRP